MARPDLTFLALALAAVSVGACNDARRPMAADSAICQPFPRATANGVANAPPPPAPNDPAAAVDDCLHRWAYALAHSSDEAQAVANAVTAACSTSLTHWNQAALVSGPSGEPPAPSLVTGQPTTPFNEHFVFTQSRALFYVVQARAGACAAPPLKAGVPVGLVN